MSREISVSVKNYPTLWCMVTQNSTLVGVLNSVSEMSEPENHKLLYNHEHNYSHSMK